VLSGSFSRSWVFFMLKEWGRRANWFTFLVNSFDNLYAGALRQFTSGRMGWSGLCIFIRPLMEGLKGSYWCISICGLCQLGFGLSLWI